MGGRSCSVCASVDGLTVSKAILGGESFRSIVNRFPSFSLGAVNRHSRKCLHRTSVKPQTRVSVKDSGFFIQSEKPEMSRSGPDANTLEGFEERFTLAAQQARESSDLRLALSYDELLLGIFDRKEKKRTAEPRPEENEWADWSTENLFALEHTREALQSGTVTAEEVEGFLAIKHDREPDKPQSGTTEHRYE